MTEIVEGLDGAQRDRIAELRKGARFFWMDVALSETSPDDLREVLAIPEPALHALLGFGGDRPSSRNLYVDESTSSSPSAAFSSHLSSRMRLPTAFARSKCTCWSAATIC